MGLIQRWTEVSNEANEQGSLIRWAKFHAKIHELFYTQKEMSERNQPLILS